MTSAEKNQMIDGLVAELKDANVFYLTDTIGLDATATSTLRRECFNAGITLRVVKNTLLQKAFEKVEGRDYSELDAVMAGPTAIMFAEAANAPAKLIQKLRKKSPMPILKGAYIEEACYIGDNQLDALVNIKSKEELIGDIVALLQSPAKNVISALSGSGQKIAGLVKTLQERA